MTLHVYEWFSYSCNNSSDHRLVAEFESSDKARAMAAELHALFLENGRQAEAALDEGGDWDPWDLEPSPALKAFAGKYGGEFAEGLVWGDEGAFTEDLPEITVLGRTVYVYHGYMSGGFDGDLPALLQNAGAIRAEPHSGPAWLEFVATAKPGQIAALQAAVDGFIGQRRTHDNFCDWSCPWQHDAYERPAELPIGKQLDKVVLLHDDERTTFTLPINANGVPGLIGWLEASGAAEVAARLVDDDAIAALREHERERSAGVGSAAPFDPRGKSFFVTGKLATLDLAAARVRVTELGGTNVDAVGSDLDVLVVGDIDSPLFGEGARTDDHRHVDGLVQAGATTHIVSESDFLRLAQ